MSKYLLKKGCIEAELWEGYNYDEILHLLEGIQVPTDSEDVSKTVGKVETVSIDREDLLFTQTIYGKDHKVIVHPGEFLVRDTVGYLLCLSADAIKECYVEL